MTFHQDIRLNQTIFKQMINKSFIKYKCDPFVFTNSVTGIVGLYIGDKIFQLKNEQKEFHYFNSVDDISLWQITESKASDIQSAFIDINQIETPIEQIIKKITLVNEQQIAFINEQCYSLWITRAIIFHLENRDIYFEKDNTAFSEEIIIKRGHNLLEEFPKRNDYFLDEWNSNVVPEVKTEFITIE